MIIGGQRRFPARKKKIVKNPGTGPRCRVFVSENMIPRACTPIFGPKNRIQALSTGDARIPPLSTSEMENNGVNASVSRIILGHAQGSGVHDTYFHKQISSLKAAVDEFY